MEWTALENLATTRRKNPLDALFAKTNESEACTFEGTPICELFQTHTEAGPGSAMAQARPDVFRYHGVHGKKTRERKGAVKPGKVWNTLQVMELILQREGVLSEFKAAWLPTRRKFEKLYGLYRKLPMRFLKAEMIGQHRAEYGDVKRLLALLGRAGLVEFCGIDPRTNKTLYKKIVMDDGDVLAALFASHR